MNISYISTYAPSLFGLKEHKDGKEGSVEMDKGSGDEKSQAKNQKKLTPADEQQLLELQQRDTEVRAHEAAHIAAGGSVVSGAASFAYEKGPDGKLYAIGGEVPISSSGGSTPEETIAIAKQIQAGALAPANPSPQDLKVASSAALMEAQARQDLALEKSQEQKEKEVDRYQDSQDETQDSTVNTKSISLQA